MQKWRKEFEEVTKDIRSDISYEASAEELRKLIRTKKLKFTDMRDDPERFFEGHRVLLPPAVRGPGFGIRFTVQFNLFAGSILGLGSDEQVKMLDDFQEKGTLGCFCLTEKFAGVNSGLVVQTTCEWLSAKQMFKLNSPTEGSEKNWISQGLTADKAVVIANLSVDGRSYGPHGFVVDLRTNKDNIIFTDMGKKTTGNDLDNARIKFDNVLIPKEALLNRFAEIRNDKYFQPTKEKMRLEVIGQRLLTGRLAIAQSAVVFTRALFNKTALFAKQRKVWAPDSKESLFNLPQLKGLFKDADAKLSHLELYTGVVEKEMTSLLRESRIPSTDLVEKIAVAKIACVETCIRLCFELKQEVGSYGLMDGTGFENLDFLQCCKFAEGDSRILAQKIARDTFRKYSKNKVDDRKVAESCKELQGEMKKKEGNAIQQWNESWEKVYALTEAVKEMHMNSTLPKAKI